MSLQSAFAFLGDALAKIASCATKSDLDALAARVATLEAAPGAQPVDLSGLATSADLTTVGDRVTAIETGLEGLDILSGSGTPTA